MGLLAKPRHGLPQGAAIPAGKRHYNSRSAHRRYTGVADMLKSAKQWTQGLAWIALLVAAPVGMAQAADRAGTWETRLGILYNNSADWDFEGGTTADIDSDSSDAPYCPASRGPDGDTIAATAISGCGYW